MRYAVLIPIPNIEHEGCRPVIAGNDSETPIFNVVFYYLWLYLFCLFGLAEY
jgi:hypothetical protein